MELQGQARERITAALVTLENATEQEQVKPAEREHDKVVDGWRATGGLRQELTDEAVARIRSRLASLDPWLDGWEQVSRPITLLTAYRRRGR